MADVVSKEKRSQMMSGIRATNTRPEILIRKALFAKGFRYRIHVKKLPGKPDIVLARYRAVIFIQGCFWHGHDCHLFKIPQTRTEFWLQKIQSNKVRDDVVIRELLEQGWRVLQIWECAIKGKKSLDMKDIVERLEEWLLAGHDNSEISWDGLKNIELQ